MGTVTAPYAATHPDAEGGKFYGPNGFRNLSGPPAEQDVYRPARDAADVARLWELSERLTGAPFTGLTPR